jgi:sulfur-carrier protein
MAELRVPITLVPLFQGLPRRVEVGGGTVLEAIDDLDRRWPGVRDRLCDPGPGLRAHINVYVDGERAGLDTPVRGNSHVEVIAAISGG